MAALLGGPLTVAVIVFWKAEGTRGAGGGGLDGFIEKRDLVHRPGTLRCG